jgi:hypothetical protein
VSAHEYVYTYENFLFHGNVRVPELTNTIIRDLPRLRDTEAISRDMLLKFCILNNFDQTKQETSTCLCVCLIL